MSSALLLFCSIVRLPLIKFSCQDMSEKYLDTSLGNLNYHRVVIIRVMSMYSYVARQESS